MRSIRGRLIIWLVRNRHLLEFKLKPEVVDSNFSVERFRADVDRVTAKMKMPEGVRIERQPFNSMNAEWIIPEHAIEGKVLLYIHGGGFISGSCNTHRTHVAKFAIGTRLRSFLFDYRLAPEHPFPAALEDCVAAYRRLLELGYQARDIVVGGESAGGTLVLSLLLELKEKGIPLPLRAFSISPVTDLRCQADSFQTNAKKDIAPMGSWDIWTKYYIGEQDPVLAPLSPHFGDFTGLPPILICVGTHEIHYDDCANTAKKAAEQGVETILSEWPGMIHAFPLFSPLFPEAKKAMAQICSFAVDQLN